MSIWDYRLVVEGYNESQGGASEKPGASDADLIAFARQKKAEAERHV